MALFIILTISLFSLLTPLAANPNSTTIPLSLSLSHHHLSDRLQHIAAASLNRALRLKSPNSDPVKIPLFPRSYGEYSVPLSFGSPPQTLPFIMDTGSSLVWFPCTSHYLCSQCDSSNSNNTTFLPDLSSSTKIVSCNDPNCELIFGPDVQSKCKTSESCPVYEVQYGSGTTSGFLLKETLNFAQKMFPDFLVGCSVFSTDQPPSGIAGFGRAKESIPSQMGLKKFAYCMISHQFDDTTKSSNLILDGNNVSGMTYTPFGRNPVAGAPAFKEYYYLTLQRVIVGDEAINVSSYYMVPGRDGNGGTIIDSGTTFTYMERPLFKVVAHEFERQMFRYRRDFVAEMQSGLQPCFDVFGDESVSVPKLTFQFKFGAEMVLPLADYFSFVGKGALCLTMVTDDAEAPYTGGPAIILGNYQQQDFYVEYDLENDRFGFKKQTCL